MGNDFKFQWQMFAWHALVTTIINFSLLQQLITKLLMMRKYYIAETTMCTYTWSQLQLPLPMFSLLLLHLLLLLLLLLLLILLLLLLLLLLPVQALPTIPCHRYGCLQYIRRRWGVYVNWKRLYLRTGTGKLGVCQHWRGAEWSGSILWLCTAGHGTCGLASWRQGVCCSWMQGEILYFFLSLHNLKHSF